jgi:RHS repeat-associated protein
VRTTTTPVTEVTIYTYNAFDQLTASTVYAGGEPTGEPQLHTQYEVGVSGEITQETVTSSTPENTEITVREFEYNPLGQTVAVSINGLRTEQEYDAAGNVTRTVDGTQYTYNVFNQPVTETHSDGLTVHSTYWVTGQHHTDTTITPGSATNASNTHTNGGINDAATTVGMYWDDLVLINDTYKSSDSSTTSSYLIGASRHAQTIVMDDGHSSNRTTNYYVTDRHGNTTAIANTAGVITATYVYSDYGTVTHTETTETTPAQYNPFQYAGEYTTTIGTQYLGTRTYDPAMFAFTTKDNAEQFNLYAYANANPITLVDPTGQTPDWDSLTNGLYAGLGLALALIGLIFAFPVGAAVWTWGSMFTVAAAVVDAGLVVAQTINEYGDGIGFLTDEQSEILTWSSLAIGGVGMMVGAFSAVQMRFVNQGYSNAMRNKAAALESMKNASLVEDTLPFNLKEDTMWNKKIKELEANYSRRKAKGETLSFFANDTVTLLRNESSRVHEVGRMSRIYKSLVAVPLLGGTFAGAILGVKNRGSNTVEDGVQEGYEDLSGLAVLSSSF